MGYLYGLRVRLTCTGYGYRLPIRVTGTGYPYGLRVQVTRTGYGYRLPIRVTGTGYLYGLQVRVTHTGHGYGSLRVRVQVTRLKQSLNPYLYITGTTGFPYLRLC